MNLENMPSGRSAIHHRPHVGCLTYMNVQKRHIHRDRTEQCWSRAGGGGEWKGTADGGRFLLRGRKIPCNQWWRLHSLEYTKTHWTTHFKTMNLMACGYLSIWESHSAAEHVSCREVPWCSEACLPRTPTELCSMLPYFESMRKWC